MFTLSLIRSWRQCVAQDLLASFHGHLQKCLADVSFAMAMASHCQADRLAVQMPTEAKPASCRRRIERLLANHRFDASQAQVELTQHVAAHWYDRTLLLLLDETPKANELRVMSIRAAYSHRALPLAMACYRPEKPPQPMPLLVRGLLEQVRCCLPENVRVVLLADRGLAWPTLVDWCHKHGWHYVLRLQGQTKVTLPKGEEKSVAELAPKPGQRWFGEAEVFKKAGWRGANVVATWERGMKEPWLLVTDQRASLRHCRTYAKRMWVEESFRDDKSSGFHWNESRVSDPVHALRLLLVMALAMLMATSIGTLVLKTGQRGTLDPRRRRRLSIVQLGLRWLRYVAIHGGSFLRWLDRLYLYPT